MNDAAEGLNRERPRGERRPKVSAPNKYTTDGRSWYGRCLQNLWFGVRLCRTEFLHSLSQKPLGVGIRAPDPESTASGPCLVTFGVSGTPAPFTFETQR